MDWIERRLTVAPPQDFDAEIAQAEKALSEKKQQLTNPLITGLRRKWLHSDVEEGQQEIEQLKRQREEAAAVDFAAGDVFAIAAPDPQDGTLADVALTLVFGFV